MDWAGFRVLSICCQIQNHSTLRSTEENQRGRKLQDSVTNTEQQPSLRMTGPRQAETATVTSNCRFKNITCPLWLSFPFLLHSSLFLHSDDGALMNFNLALSQARSQIIRPHFYHPLTLEHCSWCNRLTALTVGRIWQSQTLRRGKLKLTIFTFLLE